MSVYSQPLPALTSIIIFKLKNLTSLYLPLNKLGLFACLRQVSGLAQILEGF